MNDQLEDLVRGALTSDAEGAPLSTHEARHRVVGAASRAARVRRWRGFAVAGSALAAVLVAGVFTALAAPDRLQGQDVDPVAASPAPHPTLDPNVPWGVLRFRGVEVTVPKAMLSPDNRSCGRTMRDAAWISFQVHQPSVTCGWPVEHPEDFTEVQLSPAFSDRQAGEDSFTSAVGDGRTQVVRFVPDREVMLTVTSPDGSTAEAIANTLTVVAPDVSVDGCRLRPSGEAPEAVDTASPIAPAAPDAGLVCSYRDGWLIGAAVLDRGAAKALAKELRAAPQRRAAGTCPEPEGPAVEVTDSFALVTLEQGSAPTRIWMFADTLGDRCADPAGVNDRGRTVELVRDLVEALRKAASDDPQDDGLGWRVAKDPRPTQ